MKHFLLFLLLLTAVAGAQWHRLPLNTVTTDTLSLMDTSTTGWYDPMHMLSKPPKLIHVSVLSTVNDTLYFRYRRYYGKLNDLGEVNDSASLNLPVIETNYNPLQNAADTAGRVMMKYIIAEGVYQAEVTIPGYRYRDFAIFGNNWKRPGFWYLDIRKEE